MRAGGMPRTECSCFPTISLSKSVWVLPDLVTDTCSPCDSGDEAGRTKAQDRLGLKKEFKARGGLAQTTLRITETLSEQMIFNIQKGGLKKINMKKNLNLNQ